MTDSVDDRISAVADPSTSDANLFDDARLLGMLGGKKELVASILGTFVSSHAHALDEFVDPTGTRDPAKLAQTAHKLRGAAGNVGAVRVQALALELETALRAGVAESEVDAALARLVDALKRTLALLAARRLT